jgi:hypothetical protein
VVIDAAITGRATPQARPGNMSVQSKRFEMRKFGMWRTYLEPSWSQHTRKVRSCPRKAAAGAIKWPRERCPQRERSTR